MAFDCVIVERDGPFARITMNRPERRNALSQQHLDELLVAFRSIGDTDALGDGAGRERAGVLGRPRLR